MGLAGLAVKPQVFMRAAEQDAAGGLMIEVQYAKYSNIRKYKPGP
jgi:hypothetical protein